MLPQCGTGFPFDSGVYFSWASPWPVYLSTWPGYPESNPHDHIIRASSHTAPHHIGPHHALHYIACASSCTFTWRPFAWIFGKWTVYCPQWTNCVLVASVVARLVSFASNSFVSVWKSLIHPDWVVVLSLRFTVLVPVWYIDDMCFDCHIWQT